MQKPLDVHPERELEVPVPQDRSMNCKRCNDMNEMIEIRTPRDLERTIRAIKANCAAGTLVAEPPDAGTVIPMSHFDELEPEGPWSDYLEYRFRCAYCNRRFCLDVETYHGAGGHWRSP